MKTAFKFRIYPTNQQEAELEYAIEVCRQLWNDALADRRNAWKEEGISRTYNRQAALLIIEKEHGRYSGVYSQVLQDVLRRLSKAFENFFRRVRERARKKGYPRFKRQYKSLTYPQSGFKLEGSRLNLSKISGGIRVFLHRGIEGAIKTCTIKKDGTGAWYVIFVTESEAPSKVKPQILEVGSPGL